MNTEKCGLPHAPHRPTREEVLTAMVLIDRDLYEFNKEPWPDEDVDLKVSELHDVAGDSCGRQIDMQALNALLASMVSGNMLVTLTREEWKRLGKDPTERGGSVLYATHAHLGLWGIQL